MPMTQSGLSSAMQTAVASSLGAPADPNQLKKMCDAMAQGIVLYIQANALVTLSPTTTVTTGNGAGGTVVGTGTIT